VAGSLDAWNFWWIPDGPPKHFFFVVFFWGGKDDIYGWMDFGIPATTPRNPFIHTFLEKQPTRMGE